MASYRRPGQEWTFYEVDPTVVQLARDPRFFTYLSECSTDIRVVLGDARLSLAREASNRFDLLVLDAYNSDSIPIHLMTQQALQLYLDKITDHGLIIFHISNLYLDLTPVVANLAQELGLVCFLINDLVLSEQEELLGKEPSQWAIMARRLEDLGDLIDDPGWQRLEGSGGPVWTDSYSSIFRVLKWNSASP
jgi:spermidine synthase